MHILAAAIWRKLCINEHENLDKPNPLILFGKKHFEWMLRTPTKKGEGRGQHKIDLANCGFSVTHSHSQTRNSPNSR